MNWIGALFLAALITIGFAFYSDITMTRCAAKSLIATVGLCSLQRSPPSRPTFGHD
jgi:hypothetical protein